MQIKVLYYITLKHSYLIVTSIVYCTYILIQKTLKAVGNHSTAVVTNNDLDIQRSYNYGHFSGHISEREAGHGVSVNYGTFMLRWL